MENQASLTRKLILLAEDSVEDAEVLQLALRQSGVVNPVRVVSDGQETMDYLDGMGVFADREACPFPTVLLLDLKMPKADGFEVLEWCQGKPQLRSTLIVVLSGHQEVWRVSRAYQLGARSFLVKPCTVPEIISLTQAFPGYWMVRPPSGPASPTSVVLPAPS